MDLPKLFINDGSNTFSKLTLSFLFFAVLIFLASMLGIFTRPLANYAFFWPANALLLGLLIRLPHINIKSALLGATFGYVFADLFTGNTPLLTLILTITNLLFVITSYLCFKKINHKHQYNHKGYLNIYPFLVAVSLGSFVCSAFAIAVIPLVPDSFLDYSQIGLDFMSWLASELFNAIIILPIIIASPSLQELKNSFKNVMRKDDILLHPLPFLSVLISILLSQIFFGPGALLYPLAPLFWAATQYSLFNIAIINAFVGLTLYHSLSYLYLNDASNSFIDEILTVRVGLVILGFATILLCIISQNQKRLFSRVSYLANHDMLTETLNRRSFIKLSEKVLHNSKNKSLALMMIDIDFFKTLNDSYGHYAGDLVLKKFAKMIKDNLRHDDLFCRIGGEEFLLLVSNVTLSETTLIAERLRSNIQNTPMEIEANQPIYITASLGVVHTQLPTSDSLQMLINKSDVALYESKRTGRNKVTQHSA